MRNTRENKTSVQHHAIVGPHLRRKEGCCCSPPPGLMLPSPSLQSQHMLRPTNDKDKHELSLQPHTFGASLCLTGGGTLGPSSRLGSERCTSNWSQCVAYPNCQTRESRLLPAARQRETCYWHWTIPNYSDMYRVPLFMYVTDIFQRQQQQEREQPWRPKQLARVFGARLRHK